MKKLILFFSSVLIIALFMVGCNKKAEEPNVIINPMEPLNYSFKYKDFKDIPKLLEKQKYSYNITEDDFQFISVAIVGDKDVTVKEYKINSKEDLNINIPKNSTFIISLPQNETILYSWKIENKINENIFVLDKKFKLKIPNPYAPKDENLIRDGENYGRVAFCFSSKNIGKEKLNMVYSHDGKDNKFKHPEWSTVININVSD